VPVPPEKRFLINFLMIESDQQPAVSKVVWPWTGATHSEKPDIPCKQKAFIGFLAGSCFAALIYFHKPDHRIFSYVILGIASFIFLNALLFPPVYAGIHGGLKVFARWAGLAMSYMLLVPFYYLVFPFMRLLQLLTGKDPLNRKFPSGESTCWEDRSPVSDKAYYTRQG